MDDANLFTILIIIAGMAIGGLYTQWKDIPFWKGALIGFSLVSAKLFVLELLPRSNVEASLLTDSLSDFAAILAVVFTASILRMGWRIPLFIFIIVQILGGLIFLGMLENQ